LTFSGGNGSLRQQKKKEKNYKFIEIKTTPHKTEKSRLKSINQFAYLRKERDNL